MTRTIYALPATFGLLCAGAIAFEAAERPQDDRDRPTTNQDRDDAKKNKCYAKAESITGMDLWTRSGEDETDLGDISDFLIDAETGKITHAIISSGGIGGVGDTLRALPCDEIKWVEDDEGERKAYVDLSEDAFAEIQEFDEESADRLVREARTRMDAPESVAREGAGKKGEAGTRAASARMRAMAQMTSDISGFDVLAPGGDEAVSSVGDVYIDTERHSVCFVSMEVDDAMYVVPFKALEIRVTNREEAEDVDDLEFAYVAPRTVEQMKQAPRISEDEGRTMENPEFVRAVYAFYDMEDPRESKSDRLRDAKRERDGDRDAKRGGGRD